jgi:hypothetical protein
MDIELTPEQQVVMDRGGRGLRRVVDPRSHATYVLIPENEFITMREIIEDERREQVIHAVALRNAAGHLNDAP